MRAPRRRHICLFLLPSESMRAECVTHLKALITKFNLQYLCACWCCVPKSQDKDPQSLCQPALRQKLDGWWDLEHNPSYLGVHAKADIKPSLDIGHI